MKRETVSCLVCGSTNAAPLAEGSDYDYATTGLSFSFVRCGECAHCYLNPRPAPEAAGEIYPSSYYTLDGSHAPGAFRLLGRIKDAVVARRLRSLLDGVPRGGSVADLGCGDGALLLAVRRARPDLKLVGVDLAIARSRRARMEEAGIACLESPLESAALPPELDLVVMNQVIEHLWEVDLCLEKIASSLKKGGRLSVCTPNVDSYDARWFRRGAWGGYYFPRHLNLFSRGALERVLGRHGLRPAEWRPLVAPLVWMSTARALQVRRGWPRLLRPRDANLPLLTAFSLLDRAALLAGRLTSNQQAVAERA